MFKFTSKEIAQRLAQLLSAELTRLKVAVVKRPVDAPVIKLCEAWVLLRIPALELQDSTLDQLSDSRLSLEATKLANTIAARAPSIFTMPLPLPRGAWSTFETLGDLGFRMLEQYDIHSDENLIRVDVLYAATS